MKPIIFASLFCLMTAMLVPGCGSSDEQVKKVIKVGVEIADLQKQYYPAITELGKVAMQVEAIANRQDRSAETMAAELHKTQDLIAAAFAAGQRAQDGFVDTPRHADVDTYIKASEANRDLLKEALDKTTATVKMSHEIIDAVGKEEGSRKSRRK